MKQVRLPHTVEHRLSSYTHQAKKYTSTSTSIKSKFRKSSLMALAPLVASSLLPSVSKACTFSMTFPAPAANSTGVIDINLPFYGDAMQDFKLYYLNSTAGSFKNLLFGGTNGNAIQVVTAMGYSVIPQLSSGQSVTPTGFAVDSILPIYAGTPGSYIASPSSPLSYPIHIAIQSSEGHYGFLSIDISGGVISIVGGVSPDAGTPVIAGDCSTVSTLPVELTSFKAKTDDSSILLEWETATEINNMGFELQRSMNGKDFQKVSWIKGHDTSSEVQQYVFKDEQIQFNQLYYYRLMQIDWDGSTEYSSIITATVKNAKSHYVGTVFPNPVQDIAMLPLHLIGSEVVKITIFDNQGRAVHSFQQMLDESAQEVAIDMSDLVSGSYFARADIGSEVVYRKIMKIN